ncbi:hypothetical protein CTAYLR_001630 [Chrysophaeum taylorii]|uniref:Uncharacterized protein n=1 Tax=Chrysophaeum taylorii TaxID=2483200 RepID=A0AAD7UD79_9STRA|nr:hypothetical protein CTAYLR_001630 [Chrysophaeum taylorii]
MVADVVSTKKVIRKCVRVYPNKDRYEGEMCEGKREGEGSMEYCGEASSYVGEWRNNLYHGRGRLLAGPSRCYEGEFVAGLRHGRGRLDDEGGTYEGEFWKDRKHGAGVLSSRDARYEGEFRHNAMGPRGKLIRASGTYEGEFDRGQFHGRGRFEYGDGGTYDGEFCRGERHGSGLRVFANKMTTYSGRFEHDRQSGEGTMQSAAADRYVGGWKDDAPHGKGVRAYASGDRYEGRFEDGAFAGGKYTYRDGGYYEGEYKAGVRHGRGTRVWVSGNEYRGWFADGKMCGAGTLQYADGRVFVGHFKDDKRDGEGSEQWGNQVGVPYRCGLGYKHRGRGTCRYEGCYARECFEGYGELRCIDGRGYKGEWRQGRRHGRGEMVFCPYAERGDPKNRNVGGVDAMYRVLRYDGEWCDDTKHGKGDLEYVDGTVLRGAFANGHAHGVVRVVFRDGTERAAVYDTGRRLHWDDEHPGTSKAIRRQFRNILTRCVDAIHALAAEEAAAKSAARTKREAYARTLKIKASS